MKKLNHLLLKATETKSSAWLPDGEKNLKISLFVLTQLTICFDATDERDRHTDRQTDRHRMTT